MVRAHILPPVQFAFQKNRSRPDKLRGLQEFGPYRLLDNQSPQFGFVFPSEHRHLANQLFLALKNGVGVFKGVETTFRFSLNNDQVFAVSDFSIGRKSPKDAAQTYVDAILERTHKHGKPDLFFVLHPQTQASELDTPYYECKIKLLQGGILSQNVTLELIKDEPKFRWSVANIALAAFVKLGGVPWVVYGDELEKDLILGLGRAYVYNATSRQTTGFMGFTACFSARGLFKFLSIAEVASDRKRYLELLGKVVATSLQRTEEMGQAVTSVTLHVPKEMGREEMEVIEGAVHRHVGKNILQILVVKVTEENSFFCVNPTFPDGVPNRGTVLQVSDREYMLYTEGRDEKQSWMRRLPVALRVSPQGKLFVNQRILTVLRQINDLSQVNWRGFNARSQPISVYYGTLIARLLSHVPADSVGQLYEETPRKLLEERMWFV